MKNFSVQKVDTLVVTHLVLPRQRAASEGGDVRVVEMNLETFTSVLQLTLAGSTVHCQQWSQTWINLGYKPCNFNFL